MQLEHAVPDQGMGFRGRKPRGLEQLGGLDQLRALEKKGKSEKALKRDNVRPNLIFLEPVS